MLESLQKERKARKKREDDGRVEKKNYRYRKKDGGQARSLGKNSRVKHRKSKGLSRRPYHTVRP